MPNDFCMLWYGLRLPMSPEEMRRLDVPDSPFFQPLRDAGLEVSWENLGSSQREDYYLFVGTPLRKPDGDAREQVITDAELLEIMRETAQKLRRAGMETPPALHVRWVRYDEEGGSQWLRTVALECLSLQPGSTRAEFERLYEPAGGISCGDRYWHREARYIHVEAVFNSDAENPGAPEADEQPEDVVVALTPPYLAHPAYD